MQPGSMRLQQTYYRLYSSKPHLVMLRLSLMQWTPSHNITREFTPVVLHLP